MRYYRRLRSSESLKQWFERQRTRTCVPHTPYTSVLRFCRPQVGCMAQPCTRLVEMQATACCKCPTALGISTGNCLPCSKKNSGRTGTTSPFPSENGRPSERVVSIKLQPAAVILKPLFQTVFMP